MDSLDQILPLLRPAASTTETLQPLSPALRGLSSLAQPASTPLLSHSAPVHSRSATQLSMAPPAAAPQQAAPPAPVRPPRSAEPSTSPFGMSHQQALAQVTAQAAIVQSQQLQAEHQSSLLETRSEPLRRDPSFTPDEALEQPNPKSSVIESDSDRKCQPPSVVTDRPTDDGYNWQKYRQ